MPIFGACVHANIINLLNTKTFILALNHTTETLDIKSTDFDNKMTFSHDVTDHLVLLCDTL